MTVLDADEWHDPQQCLNIALGEKMVLTKAYGHAVLGKLRILSGILGGVLLFATHAVACSAQVDVLTQHNNLARTGANLQEKSLTPANVNVQQFGMVFKRVVDDQVYSQPLLVSTRQQACQLILLHRHSGQRWSRT